MSGALKLARDPLGFQVRGIQGLSRSATNFLREHPREARIAVAAALEAAAIQFEAGYSPGHSDMPESLRPFVFKSQPGTELLGVSKAAELLLVSRTTVYGWVEKNILLGWKSTKRGLTIPAEQIRGPGQVVSGISAVLEIIKDPELAWTFLSQDWPFAEEVARPIDKLKAGDTEEVVNAAPGFGMDVT